MVYLIFKVIVKKKKKRTPKDSLRETLNKTIGEKKKYSVLIRLLINYLNI